MVYIYSSSYVQYARSPIPSLLDPEYGAPAMLVILVELAALLSMLSTDPSMFAPARGSPTIDHGLRELPNFAGHVQNQTVRAGDDVILACQVQKLGNYKACNACEQSVR